MGDTIDGSSSAAPGAQHDETKAKSLFGRMFSKIKPNISGPLTEAEDTVQIPAGGLGNLHKMRVIDVAMPRADIISVSNDLTLPELIDVFRESGHSRLPVYADTLDEPIGMIHLKDVALKHGFNGQKTKFKLDALVRPLIFAPPSMPLGVLLQKMQTDRLHMALVIDEYGGVDGLVTIEDLVEQVVGEIADEHDALEDASWEEEKPGVYLVQARASLEEFEKVIGVDLLSDTDDEEIDTIGGLAFMMTGRVPARGEVISHPSGFEFEVVDADPRRLKTLRVSPSSAKP